MTTDAKNNCVYGGEVERARQQVCVARRARFLKLLLTL